MRQRTKASSRPGQRKSTGLQGGSCRWRFVHRRQSVITPFGSGGVE